MFLSFCSNCFNSKENFILYIAQFRKSLEIILLLNEHLCCSCIKLWIPAAEWPDTVSVLRMVYEAFFSHLQDYPKLSQSYYALLECLAQDHMTFISNLEPQVFLYLMTTISEGLTALGRSVCVRW